MAIALAAFQDHLATVFDSADSLLLIEAGPVKQKQFEIMPAGMTTIQMQHKLQALKVNVLLCGAIASVTQQSIEEAGIIVIPFLKGSLTEVEAAFFANRLNEPAFCLPGCRRGWVEYALRQYSQQGARWRRGAIETARGEKRRGKRS
jgi:predicted Fe-Mo cluster-binding NifX family protein